MNLRETLRHSLNIPTVKLGLDVGLDDVAQYARRMGIRTQIPEYPAVSIGSADVIPMQIAEAYSVFATTGFKPAAHPILPGRRRRRPSCFGSSVRRCSR